MTGQLYEEQWHSIRKLIGCSIDELANGKHTAQGNNRFPAETEDKIKSSSKTFPTEECVCWSVCIRVCVWGKCSVFSIVNPCAAAAE